MKCLQQWLLQKLLHKGFLRNISDNSDNIIKHMEIFSTLIIKEIQIEMKTFLPSNWQKLIFEGKMIYLLHWISLPPHHMSVTTISLSTTLFQPSFWFNFKSKPVLQFQHIRDTRPLLYTYTILTSQQERPIIQLK